MSFIETVGTLTIVSGTNRSSPMSQSNFGRYDVLGFFPPINGSSSVSLYASYHSAPIGPESWSMAIGTNGVPIIIPTSGAVSIESFPYETIRLSCSVAPTVAQNYVVKGQIMGALTGMAALLNG